ncbi:MAG: plastocyanin/azurin family copper-binding protein [Acidimicrobiales bacterium]
MTRRTAWAAAAIAVVVAGTATAGVLAHPAPASDGGMQTIDLGIHHSRFSTDAIEVKAGTTVRFVVTNDDPILHELIVGPPELHQRHEAGTEAAHDPRPGEVTIQPQTSATTEYTFDTPGTVEFACHLPGHRAYGMTGQVTVTP